MLADTNISQ
jgi:prolyl oligopeptidase